MDGTVGLETTKRISPWRRVILVVPRCQRKEAVVGCRGTLPRGRLLVPCGHVGGAVRGTKSKWFDFYDGGAFHRHMLIMAEDVGRWIAIKALAGHACGRGKLRS